MQVQLRYGRGYRAVDLPEGVEARVIEKQGATALADPLGAVRAALLRPTGTPPLRELARGRRDACVVLCDRTRPLPYAQLLPPLLSELEAGGIARDRVAFLVATGLHRPANARELREMLGAELAGSLRIEQHDAFDRDAHAFLGTSDHGIPAWIDRRYLAADLRILTGLIEPHLMAGYSGGRKSVCPGLASVETIRVAHGPRMLEGRIGPGLLEGNPLHEDLVQIARRARVDFIANLALDRERAVAGVFCGDLEAAHREGVSQVERTSRASLDAPADVALVSGGGDPLDVSFYQAIKGISAAAGAVRDGGAIVLCAALSEGLGSPSFTQLVRSAGGLAAFEAQLEDPEFFCVDQWMLQHLCQAARRCRLLVASDGPGSDALAELGVEHVASPERALARVLGSAPAGARVLVLPAGPYVLPVVGAELRPVGRGEPLARLPAAWAASGDGGPSR